VGRELHFQGYEVKVWCPFTGLKDLATAHANYGRSLGIPFVTTVQELEDSQVWLDGLFGFGLERSLTGVVAEGVNWVNSQGRPIVAIDIPSGLHTDTGQILGTAIQATRTFCLGLWKRGLFQDSALAAVGEAELIGFDLPRADIQAILGQTSSLQRLTPSVALAGLPLCIPPDSHKYKRGQLLIIAGSKRYRGAVVLAGLGARASGVGLLSLAVPESLQESVASQLPEALILPCPETEAGAIAQLPSSVSLDRFDSIVCGPGLTLEAGAVIEAVMGTAVPLLLDADSLNGLAQQDSMKRLVDRSTPTVLTPHPGEFQRLFPDLALADLTQDEKGKQAADRSKAILVLKGARTVIAQPQGTVWINPQSTPALARGGSGDVLAGVMGGLMAIAAKQSGSWIDAVKAAVWWHAQAGCLAAENRTVLGVDAYTLTQFLPIALTSVLDHTPSRGYQGLPTNVKAAQ
jgi:NAD(P)H-hydrate epimerase